MFTLSANCIIALYFLYTNWIENFIRAYCRTSVWCGPCVCVCVSMCDVWWNARFHTHTYSQVDSEPQRSTNNEQSIREKNGKTIIATFAFDIYFIFCLINLVMMCTALVSVFVSLCRSGDHISVSILVILNLDLHENFPCRLCICTKFHHIFSMHLSIYATRQSKSNAKMLHDFISSLDAHRMEANEKKNKNWDFSKWMRVVNETVNVSIGAPNATQKRPLFAV